ncbi:MAG: hypothetical protein HQK66_03590 [Desulfamplus sp.]|nr:hypothetical protein [Desulfamplus sp.]
MDIPNGKKLGFLGIFAISVSIAGIFVNGILAMGFAFTGVLVGIYNLKKRDGHNLSYIAVYIGASVLIVMNLYHMGILPSKIKQDVDHLVKSVEGSIAVFSMIGNGMPGEEGAEEKGGPEDKESPIGDKISPIVEKIDYALKSARYVNIQRLNKRLEGFASHFKDEYIEGLTLLERGYKNDDFSLLLQGGILLDRWSLWYNQQHHELKRIRNSTPSPLSIVVSGAIN